MNSCLARHNVGHCIAAASPPVLFQKIACGLSSSSFSTMHQFSRWDNSEPTTSRANAATRGQDVPRAIFRESSRSVHDASGPWASAGEGLCPKPGNWLLGPAGRRDWTVRPGYIDNVMAKHIATLAPGFVSVTPRILRLRGLSTELHMCATIDRPTSSLCSETQSRISPSSSPR
jgi:hypothetical protein